ncbi:unnamed protein product [Peronospora destructor]|uniref:RxLR effector protein n=1 Tax=Peronospora destructor TaxID=86335 RepID=A0AAV0U8S8_9STRA|nr:unnamed protein product [Peronospora destructor]
MQMPAKSNTAHVFYTKALIVFVALMACSSTSVATTNSIHVDAVRSSRAVDALNATYTTLSVERFLKNTSDDVSSAEERAGLNDISNILKSFSEKVMARLTPRAEWVLQRRSDTKFTRLELNNREAVDLSKAEDFHTWIAYVKGLYPDSLEKVSKAIYSTLASHFSASDLVKIFTVELPDERKRLAEEVLRVQVQSWIDSKKSGRQDFTLLKLETEGELIFQSPAFPQWVSFFMEHHKDSDEAGEWLYSFLSSRYKGV